MYEEDTTRSNIAVPSKEESLQSGRFRWLNLSRRSLTGYLFVAPAIIFLFLTSIFPLTRVFITSLTDVQAGEWYFVGWRHYLNLLQDPWFWNSMKVVTIFTITSLILHLALGLGLALLLNENWFNNTLRNFMRGLLILPWVFSPAASSLMWSLLYHPFGLLNYLMVGVLGLDMPIQFLQTPSTAMASIIAVNTWKSYPFYMLIILGGLQVIPPVLYEAAKVDGANVWQRFRYITLPSLRPVLIAISLIDIIKTVGHIDLVKILTNGGPLRSTETVAFYIYKKALVDGNLGYGAAISISMLLALTLFFLVYLRLLSGGETGETSF